MAPRFHFALDPTYYVGSLDYECKSNKIYCCVGVWCLRKNKGVNDYLRCWV